MGSFEANGGGGGGGSLTRPIVPGIANADVDPAASIVQSKLSLNGVIPPAWLGTTSTTAKAGNAAPSLHETTHLPGGTDAIPWATSIHATGLDAAKPAAAASNAGFFYFSTDVNGGTLYRSDGAAWSAIGRGLTQSPVLHAASHLPNAADAIDWTGTINQIGTHAARPAAANTNAGCLYFETDTGNMFRSNGAGWVQVAATAAGGSTLNSPFGDGSDGAVTLDGTVTPGWASKVGSVYTLTRNVWLSALTINAGSTLVGAGFRIFVAGALADNGIIHNDGNAAVANTGGAAQTSQTLAGGTAAANGLSTAANGNAPSANNTHTDGASGGAGGTSVAGAHLGGTGGVATGYTAAEGSFRTIFEVALGQILNLAASLGMGGGRGGGSGGGDGTNLSGAGGGGGGPLVIVAETITGTGAIHARGGAGAASSGGNSGGGGGGGGGPVYIVSGSVSGGAIAGITVDANGGSFGAGTGTGGNGVAGSNGTVRLIPS